jgi:hypothetical protein
MDAAFFGRKTRNHAAQQCYSFDNARQRTLLLEFDGFFVFFCRIPFHGASSKQSKAKRRQSLQKWRE